MDTSTKKRPRVDYASNEDINTFFEQFEVKTLACPGGPNNDDVGTAFKSLDAEVSNINKDCLEKKKSRKKRVTLVEIKQKIDKVLDIKDCLEKKHKKNATLNEINEKLDNVLEILNSLNTS